MRAFACLSIVLLHSIHFEVGNTYHGEGLTEFILLTISGLLAFGTATFVSISAVVLAYSYPNKVPSYFYSKRLKLIFIPFLCMGAVYAISDNLDTVSRIPIDFLFNLLGNYHGWFVLVIFQFYVLHHLFTKYFSRIPPTVMLFISFVINIAYLGFFNFVSPPENNIYFKNMWERWYWYPFFGWVFYYTLAYYIGKNYADVIRYVKKYSVWVFTLLPVSAALIVLDNVYLDLPFGSKRVDMVLFTVISMFALLFICHKFKRIPALVSIISRYSFGIYLFHWSGLFLSRKIFNLLHIDFGYFNIILWFFISMVSSIFVIYILNKFSLGKYMIGQVKEKKNDKSSSSPSIPEKIQNVNP